MDVYGVVKQYLSLQPPTLQHRPDDVGLDKIHYISTSYPSDFSKLRWSLLSISGARKSYKPADSRPSSIAWVMLPKANCSPSTSATSRPPPHHVSRSQRTQQTNLLPGRPQRRKPRCKARPSTPSEPRIRDII